VGVFADSLGGTLDGFPKSHRDIRDAPLDKVKPKLPNHVVA